MGIPRGERSVLSPPIRQGPARPQLPKPEGHGGDVGRFQVLA